MISAVGSFFFGEGAGQFFAPELSRGKKLAVFLDEEQPELAIRMLDAEFPLEPDGGAAAGFDAADADAVVNFRDEPSGNRPLHYAAARGGLALMPAAVDGLVRRGRTQGGRALREPRPRGTRVSHGLRRERVATCGARPG